MIKDNMSAAKSAKIKILAIETSCDETAAAVIGDANITGKQRNQATGEQWSNKTMKQCSSFVLSNVVSSQIDLHAKTGGVVPEVASRAHMEAIIPVIKEALSKANDDANPKAKTQKPKNNGTMKPWDNEALSEITHIAVTAGPGLIGSLLVGFNTAKALSYALDIPIIPVNHIEGHIYSAFSREISTNKRQDTNKSQYSNTKSPKETLQANKLTPNSFPILALTVSGGHTSLTLMRDHGVYENIGSTLDDAAGEAFDKVAKLLDLGYPGGPAVSRYAAVYREKIKDRKSNVEDLELTFPRPLLDQDNFNFSFSGLKTAVLYCVQKLKNQETKEQKNNREVIARNEAISIKKIATAPNLAMTEELSEDLKQQICYEFEEAVVDVLVGKTLKACEAHKPKAVILAGGVAANRRLREVLNYQLSTSNYPLIMPPLELCGDNAAMIGTAAFYHILRGDTKRWDEIKVDSNFKL